MKTAAWVCAVIAAGCGSDKTDVARTTVTASAEPAGQNANVLDNPMHAAHLTGTTPLPCSGCHGVGADKFEAPSSQTCLSCHPASEVALHGDEVACSQCHSFAAGTTGESSTCQSCHADPQGERMAIKAHAKVKCDNCHVAHGDPALAVKSCLNCHDDHQEGHGKPDLTLVERCSQCHPPHTKSLEAVARCQSCHEEKLVKAVFRGHNKCETCHQNDRQSAPKKPIACATCHGGRVTLASTRSAAHRKCESCHAPHDPRGTAVQSCRRCHDGVIAKHPAKAGAGKCLGCHPAHPRSPEATVAACSSCHREARTDSSLHATGEITCKQCHSAHSFEPAGCRTCHSSSAIATATGHDKCSGCHRKAHAPKASASTCSNCHVPEYDTAPTGHRECARCHEPHGGKLRKGSGCQSCHADRLGMTHGRISGGCKSCHRAHGPAGRAKPPACTVCHQRNKLPGLHAVADHNKCSGCHTGHGMRALTRKTCLGSCHEKQVDHEPVANTCVGCHPFGGSR